MFNFIKLWPKLSLLLALIVLGAGFLVIFRGPDFVKCGYNASFIQSLPGDSWRFNITPSSFEKQCQYRRSDGRWIPLNRVTDVGADMDDDGDI